MSSGLKETVDVLDALIADGEAEGFGTRYDTEILSALKELRAIRNGEFLCSRCRTHEAEDMPPAEF
jgi:hypothetical protein